MGIGILRYKEYQRLKQLEQADTTQQPTSTQEPQGLESSDGILIIVDVQGEFDQYTPQGFEENIMKYCDEFPKGTDENDVKGVYQIWDSNKATGYTYTFPNQVSVVRKNYGTKFNTMIRNIAMNKLPQDSAEGKLFKFKDSNKYLVKVNNNHKWFFVNEELYNLYQRLKGKRVIIVGGADSECLQDVYISMKSFGIIPTYNHKYIYNASMNDDMKSTDKQENV